MISRLLRTLGRFDVRRHGRFQELFATRAASGPYRFLVRGWSNFGELELAKRVVGTEYFTTQVRVVPLPVATSGPMVVIAPHQDDEIIGCGGLMLLARRAGIAIHVVYATNGAQKGKGQSTAEMSAARDAEAGRVCAELGATIHRLDIDNIAPRPSIDHVLALRSLLSDIRPKVILAPWILDAPPKHRLVSHLLSHALKPIASSAEVWYYQVHSEIFPNAYVDITDVADDKRRLLNMYRSQIDGIQAYDHITLGRDAWNSRYLKTNPSPRSVELYFTLPAEESVRLIARTYERDLIATYRGNRTLAAVMTELSRQLER